MMNVFSTWCLRAPCLLAMLCAALLAAQQPGAGAAAAPPAQSAGAQSSMAPVPAATPAAALSRASATPQAGTPPGTAGTGQTPAAPSTANTLTANARLVVLDMVVVDSKGVPVQGLTREDFHIAENGDPQTIRNFETAGKYMPAPELTIDSTADLDRLAPRAPVNILLLDEFNTRFEDMAFARYSLKKFLDRQPDKLQTPTMLIAVSLQKFQVLRDYTQNKAVILHAVDHHFAAYPWQAHQFGWISERYALAFETLRRVAQASVGHFGHKNMIWVGRGFPNLNFANIAVDGQTRIENAVQSCVNTLRDARVTLYTIDPAGVMVDPGKYGAGAQAFEPFGGEYQFNAMTRATGGRSLYGRNDVDAEIGTAIRDGSSFYTLSYRPTDSTRDLARFRRIDVTVDKPGLQVITRKGYYLQYGPGRVDPQNPSRRLIGDLVAARDSTMVYDGVPMTLDASPTDPSSFMIRIDGRSLYWTFATATEPRRVNLILLVSTFDKKGKEIKEDVKRLSIPAPADVPPTGRLERGLNLHYVLTPDPKAVHARFVIRLDASGRIGSADVTLGGSAAAAAHPSGATAPAASPASSAVPPS